VDPAHGEAPRAALPKCVQAECTAVHFSWSARLCAAQHGSKLVALSGATAERPAAFDLVKSGRVGTARAQLCDGVSHTK